MGLWLALAVIFCLICSLISAVQDEYDRAAFFGIWTVLLTLILQGR